MAKYLSPFSRVSQVPGFGHLYYTLAGYTAHGYRVVCSVELDTQKNWPELCVVGCDSFDQGKELIQRAVERLANSESAEDVMMLEDFTEEGFPVLIKSIDPEKGRRFVPWVGQHAPHLLYKTRQIMLPDPAGKLPWDLDVRPDFRHKQTILLSDSEVPKTRPAAGTPGLH